MHLATPAPTARGLALALGWRRVLFTLVTAALMALLVSPAWQSPVHVLVLRAMAVGLLALLAFGLFEQWPKRLPRWLARWALQVVGVAAAVPLGVMAVYVWGTETGQPAFWRDTMRLAGFGLMTFAGLVVGPWVALAVLLRQRDAHLRHQTLAFELERSELERKALDSRLRLLQSQVEPHFLFNTLANVRELVDSGSPKASAVLGSLINYLRAAVPRLNAPATTLGQELQLVRAYLELMHMRMPDRLQFSVQAGPESEALRCPPMTLLTLVENAVRHGIDPGEEGGRIDVQVQVHRGLQGARCHAQVVDTGVGLRSASTAQDDATGLGSGLATLRERLQLAFGADATLHLHALQPHGTRAEVSFPALPTAT